MRNRCDSISKVFLITVISASIVFLDYITKKLILTHVMPHQTINVTPFLRIVNVKNTGAAFGILSNLGNNIFIFVSAVAIIAIIIYLLKTDNRLEIFSLSLILGGAIGNLRDRATIGKVVDFIDFFIDKWHWPAFNVADSALTVGIMLFLFANIKQLKHRDETHR